MRGIFLFNKQLPMFLVVMIDGILNKSKGEYKLGLTG